MRSDDIGLLIKQISDKLLKEANNTLRQDNLTLTQVGALEALYSADSYELTLKEIERILSVTQPTAHGIIKRLVDKGLVETCDDDRNHRVKHAKLTAAGIEKASHASERMKAAEALLTGGLSEKETAELRKLLSTVRDNM